jgi:hypothetical protein
MADHEHSPITSGDEEFERQLDRHRADDQQRVRAEVVARLKGRGIIVGDAESMEIVVELLEAMEAFERAVEAKGGDLMVDTAPAPEPDDPRFVLPMRAGGEAVEDYIVRLRRAASHLANSRDD